MTILYFTISALDLLNALPPLDKQREIIEWIYSNYITARLTESMLIIPANAGFRGSSHAGNKCNDVKVFMILIDGRLNRVVCMINHIWQ